MDNIEYKNIQILKDELGKNKNLPDTKSVIWILLALGLLLILNNE